MNHFRAGVKGVVILTPLLGINWLFGLLAVNKHLVVFEFMFVLLNSLQGLFIFLFHCVGSSEVSRPVNVRQCIIYMFIFDRLPFQFGA